ncbi:hypothetical protein [Roseibium sp.]|uniref:hypothetical protein n=1 Tax=Roseibium sp. TaxID=1936156 RepID=UPI003B51E6AB
MINNINGMAIFGILVTSLSISAANAKTAKIERISVNPGQYKSVDLLAEDKGFCFLSGIERMNGDSAAEIAIKNGTWVIEVKSDDAQMNAWVGCVKY